MTPEQIHDIAVTEFQLVPHARRDGWSYWTPETATSKSVRILRVSRANDGGVAAVKLASTSNALQQEVFLTAPITASRIRQAIADELAARR